MEKKHFELEKQYTISLTNGHKLIEFNCEIELGQVFTENKIDKTSELTEILQDNFDDFNDEEHGSFYSTDLDIILKNYESVNILNIKSITFG
jgi:succinylglutamate desuccinylase